MAYKGTIENKFDPSRHLSIVANARSVSPLKGLQKYLNTPGLISLAGGLPSPAYFPFDVLNADVLAHDKFPTTPTDIGSSTEGRLNWLWNLFSSTKSSNSTISVPKYGRPNAVQLATALQYSMAKGIPQLIALCQELVTKVQQPRSNDWSIIMDTGNTDGWAKCIQTFCNPGETVLYDEWTYPSALSASRPLGISAAPVALDEQGMCSDDLRHVLESWDEEIRGSPRPHVMYIVPIGQNPTGATMGLQRKQEIYNICVEFDVLIVEDDPYFFLQFGKYRPPTERSTQRAISQRSDEAFTSGLAPSFLRIDYQSRVVRLDTFSKTIAPGCRLGWITCHPVFSERLERALETSTQAPCGFGQTLVCTLLLDWKYDGFIRWVNGLAAQYTRRRTLIIDLLIKKFDIELAPLNPKHRDNGTYLAYQKHTRYTTDVEKGKRRHIFSFTPPTSGMFVWLEFNLEGHRRFPDDGDETVEMLFWITVAKEGLLIGPGSMFAADPSVAANSRKGHFRISFATEEDKVMMEAVDKLARAVDKFYTEC